MSTRMYFSSLDEPAASPAFGGWTDTTIALRRKLLSAKSAAESLGFGPALDDIINTRLDRQYVSDPLSAQEITGTVKLQVRLSNPDELDDTTSRLLIRVCSGDGSTFRGTLLALGQHGPNTAYNPGSLRNKTFADGDALSSVTAQDGDRLVVEVGHALLSGSAGSGQAHYGAPSGTSDLPENETTTTALVPWIEFSADLAFQAVSGGSCDMALLGVGN